jgi:hypothetical protein
MSGLVSKVRQFMEKAELFHRLCGLERSTFDDLVNELDIPFKRLTWRGTERINQTNASDLPVDIALWITLFWMRQYPTGVVMGAIFDCHERTLHRVFKRTITALMKGFHEELKWPNDDELLSWKLPSNVNTHMEDIVCYADGTVLHGPRSILKFASGANDPFFNYAKHKHGMNIVCVVNPYGKIIWSTNWERGGMVDQTISNSVGLRDDFLGKAYGIAADGGFTFNKKGEQNRIITAKPHRLNAIVGTDAEKEEMRNFNKLLSSNRVIVENVFARLKQWRIIGGFMRHFHPNTANRGNLLDLNDLFQTLCTIHNRDLKDHPMRA